jgi:hypothetical protein
LYTSSRDTLYYVYHMVVFWLTRFVLCTQWFVWKFTWGLLMAVLYAETSPISCVLPVINVLRLTCVYPLNTRNSAQHCVTGRKVCALQGTARHKDTKSPSYPFERNPIRKTEKIAQLHTNFFKFYLLSYWLVAYRENFVGVFKPPPPLKFRSFDKAGPNSQLRGKYIRNNLIRIQVSLICKLSGTPN